MVLCLVICMRQFLRHCLQSIDHALLLTQRLVRPLHPYQAVCVAIGLTALLVLLFLPHPKFAGPGRQVLLTYHAPLFFVFVLYILDRLRCWAPPYSMHAIESLVCTLALLRTLIAVPFISGHALLATFLLATPRAGLVRWSALSVLGLTLYYKVVLLHDPTTLVGGVILGLLFSGVYWFMQ